MKKILTTLLITVLAALSVFALTACNTATADYFRSVYDKYDNLAKNATYKNSDGKELKSFSLKDKAGRRNDFIDVDLGSSVTFNTITLAEDGEAVLRFSIYASNDGKKYEFLTKGDTIERGRVLAVGDVTYRYLRIFTVQVKANYNVNDLGVYYIKTADANKLRNTAYLVVGDINEDYDLSTLEGFTDIILFGTATLTADGNVEYHYGKDANGNEITDDGTMYGEKLAIIRKALGDRVDEVTFIGDLYLPYGKVYEMQSDHLETTVQSVKAYVNRFGLDGYDIDYEYPRSNKEWKAYNTYLRAVKAAMPDKILSIATSAFALKFDKETVDAIDRVQYMVYDDYDSNGYQSSFPFAVDRVRQLLECGFPANKIELGVPTYSRPTNDYAFWGNYKDYAHDLGKYENLIYADTFDHEGMPLTTPQYFNSYQTIADKTAFAIDAGLGGIMMFRVGCDLPYSDPLCLARAVVETIAAKQA